VKEARKTKKKTLDGVYKPRIIVETKENKLKKKQKKKDSPMLHKKIPHKNNQMRHKYPYHYKNPCSLTKNVTQHNIQHTCQKKYEKKKKTCQNGTATSDAVNQSKSKQNVANPLDSPKCIARERGEGSSVITTP